MKNFETLTIQKQIIRQLDQIEYVVNLAMRDLDKIRIFKENNPKSAEDLLPIPINDTVHKILTTTRGALTLLVNRIEIDQNGKEAIHGQLSINAKSIFNKVDDAVSSNRVLQEVALWVDKIAIGIENIQATKKKAWSEDVDAIEQLWILIRVI